MNCIAPMILITVLENSTGASFVDIEMVLEQPAGLSQEMCLYADTGYKNKKQATTKKIQTNKQNKTTIGSTRYIYKTRSIMKSY